LQSVLLALSRLPDEARFAALCSLEDYEVARLAHTWEGWARDDQLPPATTASGTPWRTWLVLGGRGAGKTRTGAEWVRARALGPPYSLHRARRIALVGETLGQVRSVMIEGLSGLLSIHPEDERPRLEISRSQLVWPNGAMAQMFAADDPDSLRGPQFDAAWCDELCKWRVPEKAWDMLQFALRLGPLPQCVVTTTPRPIALLTAIKGDEATVTSHSRTVDNVANLAPAFLAEMQRRYADTPLGRQELDGEIVEDRMTGIWKRAPTCSRWRAATTRIPTIRAAPPTSASRSASSCATRASSSPPTISPP
jgi:phage terminase large subunit-like protein